MKRVWLLIVSSGLLFISLVAWGFSSPAGSSPDEDFHLVSIWCSQNQNPDLCQPSEDPLYKAKIPAALLEMSYCYAHDATKSANCEIKPTDQTLLTGRGNFNGDYPPLFYSTMGLFVGEDITSSVLLMRIFNSALLVALIIVTYLFSPVKLKSPLIWGLTVSIVPLGMFIIPSINPSSWAVISASILWVSMTAFFFSENTKGRIVLGIIAFIAILMGAGARSDSAIYSLIALFVSVIISWQRLRENLKLVLLSALLGLVSLLFFFSSGQSDIVSRASDGTEQSLSEVIFRTFANLAYIPELWGGALGSWGLGWLDTPTPGLVWITTIGLFVAFVFWGLKTAQGSKGIAVAIVFFSMIAIPTYILVREGLMVGAGVQPRYIFPLMILLAGISLLNIGKNTNSFSNVQIYAAASSLAIANSLALHVNLRRYVTGSDIVGFNLNKNVEWWWNIPVGPMWVWLIGSTAFGLAVLGFSYLTQSQHFYRVEIKPIDKSILTGK